jgi:hypothetical protein
MFPATSDEVVSIANWSVAVTSTLEVALATGSLMSTCASCPTSSSSFFFTVPNPCALTVTVYSAAVRLGITYVPWALVVAKKDEPSSCFASTFAP